MDFVKQYLTQSLSAASNNLRLNNQQIEVVALLREAIINSSTIEEDIKNMKKITELSTLAIRLNEIYTFLTKHQIDLYKLSEKFREHSQDLIKDLNRTLEIVSPALLNDALNKLKQDSKRVEPKINVKETLKEEELKIDETKKKKEPLLENIDLDDRDEPKKKPKLPIENITDAADISFPDYEEQILKPIKPIDYMLTQLSNNDVSADEINHYAHLMKKNGEISAQIGFEIISGMHNIFSKALQLIKTRDLMPGKEIIDSMRACLIVIVAVIKGKEIDITAYLNKAEDFGRKIQTLKIKD